MTRCVAATVWASIVCILTIAGAPDVWAQPQPPTPVAVENATQERVQELRRVTGEIRALRVARVATQEAGIVDSPPIRAGQKVTSGQVLVKLESGRLDLERKRIVADRALVEATLFERTAELQQAERDLESLTELARQNASNPKELLDAETNVVRATSRVTQEERRKAVITQRLALLDRRIKDMEISAPFAGTITETFVEEGNWVGEGDAVVELISDGQVEAWLAVPERFRLALDRPGASINVTLPATGATVTSQDFRIVPSVSSDARNFPIIVKLKSPPPGTTPGMSVSAEIPTGELKDHLVVPRDALSRGDVGLFVYQVIPGAGGTGTVVPVTVNVLFTMGNRVVVDAPIKPGTAVVVEGNERLFPGMTVAPIPRRVKKALTPEAPSKPTRGSKS